MLYYISSIIYKYHKPYLKELYFFNTLTMDFIDSQIKDRVKKDVIVIKGYVEQPRTVPYTLESSNNRITKIIIAVS